MLKATFNTLQVASLVGKKVGFVRVAKPQHNTERYEFAAWYTAWLSDVGDFDLTLASNDQCQLSVYARLPATTTSNYHAPHFGGMPCGPGEDRTGQRGDFAVSMNFGDACSSYVPSKNHRDGMTFHIDHQFLDACIEYTETEYRDLIARFPEWVAAYQKTPRSRFNSELEIVAACAGWIEAAGRTLGYVLDSKAHRPSLYEQVQGRYCLGCYGNICPHNDDINSRAREGVKMEPHPADPTCSSLCYDCRWKR